MSKGVVAVVGVSVGERERRRGAVNEARHSTEMEGGWVSEEAEADLARYVAGELTSDELIERAHQRVAQSAGG